MGELCDFDPNDINVIEICLCKNKGVIYGKRKKCWSKVKAIFSNVMLSCYLYFLYIKKYVVIIYRSSQ